jgi:hypothetical protein
LGLERCGKTVLVEAKFEEMGFYPVLDLPYSFLVGCAPKDEEHEQSCQEGNEDHPVPGTETTKRVKQNVENLTEQGVKYPHSKNSSFPENGRN